MAMLGKFRGALVVACVFVAGSAFAQKESLLISSGDFLHIQVFDTPELEQHARVTDAGDFPLVMGGIVRVADLTPAQAARAVEEVLQQGQILLRPRVVVTVDEYATQKVSVLGEVKVPGAYAINTPRSVLDVLTLAGGLTDMADRKVLIKRRASKDHVPYFVSNNADIAVDTAVLVNPGDSVIVPRAGIVYVLGDVGRPGGYTMTNNEAQITVLELVARAGGTNHDAAPAHAKLIHKSSDTFIEKPLPLSAMQKGNRPDLPLQADDIVYVPFSYLRSFGMQASSFAGQAGSAAVYKF